MKAFTVAQPWAWAIAQGGKTVENRVWCPSYRGPVAIHAGKSWQEDVESFPPLREAWETMRRNPPPGLDAVGPMIHRHPLLPEGVIVAIAELADVCSELAGLPPTAAKSCKCGPWAMVGFHHLKLEKVRPLLKPVEVRGWMKLWDLPDDVAERFLREVGGI